MTAIGEFAASADSLFVRSHRPTVLAGERLRGSP